MDLIGEKIINVVIESLSQEDLENILRKKKQANNKPKEINTQKFYIKYYTQELIKIFNTKVKK